jgi:predicted nucleic acid-binding protein
VPERGAADVAAIWLSADRRVSSLVLYPETRAAIGRARRMGRIRQPTLARARRRVEELWAAVDRIELTIAVAHRAGELAERHGLGAYDAVHLASLEHVGDPATMLASADDELLEAASSLGFTVAPAGS